MCFEYSVVWSAFSVTVVTCVHNVTQSIQQILTRISISFRHEQILKKQTEQEQTVLPVLLIFIVFQRIKSDAVKKPKTFPSLVVPNKLSHGENWESCSTPSHREMFKLLI